ncbi:MAG: YraN family protein [Oscillospiraceae bacterium]|jgi:putative endonuclease|nr:YraN family protein [Oscillospiraceae bacterium]
MPAPQQSTGSLGEDAAARHLESRGFAVLRRNYHTRQGEVDIIARDARFLLFVEVKARGLGMWGTPGEAVTPDKQRKIILAAQRYMLDNPSELQPRFDVAELYLDAAGQPRKLRWLADAFQA